jgi:hypothetical protein
MMNQPDPRGSHHHVIILLGYSCSEDDFQMSVTSVPKLAMACWAPG